MWVENLNIKQHWQWKPNPFSYSMVDIVAFILNNFEPQFSHMQN